MSGQVPPAYDPDPLSVTEDPRTLALERTKLWAFWANAVTWWMFAITIGMILALVVVVEYR